MARRDPQKCQQNTNKPRQRSDASWGPEGSPAGSPKGLQPITGARNRGTLCPKITNVVLTLEPTESMMQQLHDPFLSCSPPPSPLASSTSQSHLPAQSFRKKYVQIFVLKGRFFNKCWWLTPPASQWNYQTSYIGTINIFSPSFQSYQNPFGMITWIVCYWSRIGWIDLLNVAAETMDF